VGVCLSAGYFGFYGHIGFLQGLKQLGIRASAASGCSSGAMTGAFFAAGMDPDEMPPRATVLRKDEFWDPLPLWRVALSLMGGGRGFMGVLRGQKLRERLARDLPVPTFERCQIPFCTVSTNITRRVRNVDRRGDLAEAVTASAAFPVFFSPVPRADGDHWDGGIVDKTPISALLGLEKLDVVIVHYVPPAALRKPDGFHLQELLSGWKALDACVDVLRHRDTLHQVALAAARGVDVLVTSPRLPRIGPGTMHRAPRAILKGARNVLTDGAFHLMEAGTLLDP
jgi:NTE family protein